MRSHQCEGPEVLNVLDLFTDKVDVLDSLFGHEPEISDLLLARSWTVSLSSSSKNGVLRGGAEEGRKPSLDTEY
jgi:hypothetical protein